jgi:uncharacterized protein YeaO (DUF488 family)
MKRVRSLAIEVKRVYDPPAASDGHRVLVDRLWPRGLSKETAKINAWLGDVAPSADLRKWFGHEPSRWLAFKRKYFRELDRLPQLVEQLLGTRPGGTLTLLFAAKDRQHNNAVALKAYLDAWTASKR